MSSLDSLLAKVNNARAAIKARNSFTNVERLPSGSSRWRILPGKVSPAEFFREFGRHYVKDSTGAVKAVLICDEKTYGMPCDTCAEISSHIRATTATKDDAALKALKEANAAGRFLVNALRIDGPSPDPKNAKLLELPSTVMDQFLALIAQRIAEDIDMLDLKEGYDVVIDKSGTGMNTSYTTHDVKKSTVVDISVMDTVTDIDEWLKTEKQKGLTKAAMVAPTLASISGRALPPPTISGTTTPALTGGSSPALVPAARPARAMVTVDPTVAEEADAAPAAPKAAVKLAADEDEDLARMLEELDKTT